MMSLTHAFLCLLPRAFFFHDDGALYTGGALCVCRHQGCQGIVAPDGIFLFNMNLEE